MSLTETKSHTTRASREVHLTQFLSTIICWGWLALQIGGWWTLIRALTSSSKSIGLLARERVQNANYLIINIQLLEWILTGKSSGLSGSRLTWQDYHQTGSRTSCYLTACTCPRFQMTLSTLYNVYVCLSAGEWGYNSVFLCRVSAYVRDWENNGPLYAPLSC